MATGVNELSGSLKKLSKIDNKVIYEKIDDILRVVTSKASDDNKVSMFSIASTANINNPAYVFPTIRETENTVCGTILINTDKDLRKIIKKIDGIVEIILVDAETKVPEIQNLTENVRELTKKSKVLTYKPNDLTVDAADALIAQLFISLNNKKIAIFGGGNIGSKLALKLVERGANVSLVRRDKRKLQKIVQGLNYIKSACLKNKISGTSDINHASTNADVLIGTTPGIPVITTHMIQKMNPSGLIIDIGNGTLFPEAIKYARDNNIKTMCLIMKPGYDGSLKTIFETEKIISAQKSKKIKNFFIISGGFLGNYGDIIVDNAEKPTKIFAIADGNGDIIHQEEREKFQKRLEYLQKYVIGRDL